MNVYPATPEPEVGEVFRSEVFPDVLIETVESGNNSCFYCIFNEVVGQCLSCDKNFRKDGRAVIFKRVESN